MTAIRFTKAHATGDDVILIADPDNAAPLDAPTVTWLSDRRTGVGTNVVIRAVRSSEVPEGRALLAHEPAAQWFFDAWNADGSPRSIGGNSIRSFARFLVASGLAPLGAGETLTLATRAGLVDVQLTGTGGFQVDLGRWRLDGAEPLVLADGLAVARPALAVTVGRPHLVVALSTRDELDELSLANAPDIDGLPATGTDVHFLVPADQLVKDGVGRLHVRSWVDGVGETASSGVGAVAAALAVRQWAGAAAPNHWRVAMPGGVVQTRMFATEEGEHVSLAGPAELVFDGAIAVPEPATAQ